MARYLTMDDTWWAKSGYGFGFAQPVMGGCFYVCKHVKFETRAIATFFETLLGLSLEDRPVVSNTKAFIQAILHWSYLLQKKCRISVFEVGYAISLSDTTDNRLACQVVMPYTSMQATYDAVKLVLDVIDLLIREKTSEEMPPMEQAEAYVKYYRDQYKALAHKGVNVDRLLTAAVALDVPFYKISTQIYMLGYGKHARIFNSTITEQTTSIGVALAKSKMMTAKLLRLAGLPTVHHKQVANSAEAKHVAQSLGYPVVVKPTDKDGGEGVYAGLKNESELVSAYNKALSASTNLLVEKHITGHDYRITVRGDNIVKAVVRKPGRVTGDGVSTIRELIDQFNQDPVMLIRIKERGKILLCLDQEAHEMLAEQGLEAESVLATGRQVILRRRANVSSGGTTENVIDQIHPDNAAVCIRAASVLRLDIAGIDFMMPDISKSWLEVGGAICEVNAQPQINVEFVPHFYQDFIRASVPNNGRIYTAMLVGMSKTQAIAQQASIVASLKDKGHQVFYANEKGNWLNDSYLSPPCKTIHEAAMQVMFHQQATATVLCATEEEIQAGGLPLAQVDVVYLAALDEANNDQIKKQETLTNLIKDHSKHLIKLENFDIRLVD